MNILLVSPLPPPSGGMATWTEQYLKNSDKINNVYTVNTAFIGKRALHRGHKMNIFLEFKRLFIILCRYYRILKHNEIDIIHINSACSKIGIFRDAICVALGKNYPIVFHCHCNIQDQLIGKIALKIGNFIFNSVSYVLVLNNKSFEFVQKQSNVKLALMPNSIDIMSNTNPIKVHDDLKNIIFVGHVKREKGIYEIMEAAKQEKNIIFHLVGPVSDEISNLNMPKNVICYGRMDRNDVMKKMYDSDILLFPSYTEGFSMVMLEAMAVGLPIIASDVGSNSDMIENKGGLIISPKSTEEIVNAIELMRCKSIRDAMSKWNLNKVKNNYRSDIIFGEIQKVYHEIVK